MNTKTYEITIYKSGSDKIWEQFIGKAASDQAAIKIAAEGISLLKRPEDYRITVRGITDDKVVL